MSSSPLHVAASPLQQEEVLSVPTRIGGEKKPKEKKEKETKAPEGFSDRGALPSVAPGSASVPSEPAVKQPEPEPEPEPVAPVLAPVVPETLPAAKAPTSVGAAPAFLNTSSLGPTTAYPETKCDYDSEVGRC